MRFIIHVSTIVSRDGRILLVRETGAQARHTWNLPGGHLGPGEAMLDGAQREVREETGLDVMIDSFVGVYTGKGGDHCINFVFAGAPGSESGEGELPWDWLAPEAIGKLPDDTVLNSRKLRCIIQDWQRRRLPVDVIRENLYG